MDTLISVMLFILMNFAAAGACILLMRAFFGDEAPGARVLIALSLFPILVLIVLIVLGMVGLLTAPMACAVFVAIGAVAYALNARGSRVRETSAAQGPKLADWPGLLGSTQGKLTLAILIFAAAPTVMRGLFAGPYFSVDDLSYHAPYVTWWMQHQAITYEHAAQFTAYYPVNSELLALWFVLPFGTDAFATLSGTYWGVLMGVSMVLLLLNLGRSLMQSLLLPALVITLPIIPISLLRYAAVDVAGVAAIIAAMTLLLCARPSPRIWFLAGMLSGFAVGSKLTFVGGAGVLGLWLVLGPADGAGLTMRIKRAVYHLAGLLVTGSFWYIHNYIMTGNPAFPAELGPFPGPVPAEHFNKTSFAGWLSQMALNGRMMQELIRSHIDWPWPHFILGAIGSVSCLVLLIKQKVSRRERGVYVLVMLLIVVSLVSFVFMPASKPVDVGGGVLEVKHRFLILAAVLSMLCLALAYTRTKRGWVFFVLVTSLSVAAVWPGSPLMALAVVIPLAGVLLGWKWLSRVTARVPVRRFAYLYFVAVLLALALWHPYAQRLTDRRMFAEGFEATSAWQKLEDLPPGAEIVSVGPSSSNIYPLFGRDLTLHPSVGNWRGDVRRPLHELWKENPQLIEWHDEGPSQNLASFASNMRKAGVGYVYLTRQTDGEWPPHLAELKALGDSCLVFGDEKAQIWKLPALAQP